MAKNPEQLSRISIIVCDDIYREGVSKKLIMWANRKSNEPPDSWWDDDTDPFTPET